MNGDIGKRIRAIRESKKISRSKLATQAGISTSALSDLELGYSQTSLKLHRIATALGVQTSWLETGRGQMEVSITGENKTPYLAASTISPPATEGDYVRIQQLDAEAGMGGEVVNDDYPDVIRSIDFSPEYIRGIVGFVPPAGRMILMTGRGDSMVPTIQPGDTVVVDTGVQHFDGDGLYLINMGNGHQIKRLLDRGRVHVVSDNRAYGDPFPIPEGTVVGGKVYLRNRIERFN